MTWRRVVIAAAALAFLGAGAGTAFGLVRAKDDGPPPVAQASPSDSVTQTPSDPAASGSESQCTTDCPTSVPGTRTATVPHVVGHDEAGARSRVQGRGLTPQVKYVCHDPGTAGAVIAQSPKGDTQANTGSRVTLDVRGVSVLNVVGQYHGDAKGRLEEAGFTVTVNNHRPGTAGGEVSSQSPAGNSCVKRGSPVSITVGQPPTPSPSTRP